MFKHLLSLEEIEDRLKPFVKWQLTGGKLKRTFVFDSFAQSMEFFNAVAEISEELNHHPAFMNEYCRCTISIFTHDLGGISALDFEFINQIEQLELVRSLR